MPLFQEDLILTSFLKIKPPFILYSLTKFYILCIEVRRRLERGLLVILRASGSLLKVYVSQMVWYSDSSCHGIQDWVMLDNNVVTGLEHRSLCIQSILFTSLGYLLHPCFIFLYNVTYFKRYFLYVSFSSSLPSYLCKKNILIGVFSIIFTGPKQYTVKVNVFNLYLFCQR